MISKETLDGYYNPKTPEEINVYNRFRMAARKEEPVTHIWIYKNRDLLEKVGIKIHPSHIEAGKKMLSLQTQHG